MNSGFPSPWRPLNGLVSDYRIDYVINKLVCKELCGQLDKKYAARIEGLLMVPRSRNARGSRTPYVLADPPLVHREGPDMRLPKTATFRRGDAAARAVIGPLTKTRRRTMVSTASKRLRGECVA